MRRGARLAPFWLEMLFFSALAIFGFSAVSYLLGAHTQGLLSLPVVEAADSEPEPVEYGLFEAPSQRPVVTPALSSIFTPSVQYWKDDILEWAAEYDLDPNLVATVMQIESCGYPLAGSQVGAIGLFQVMPYHFAEGEKPFDPDTNAARGMEYLLAALELSNGHAGLALAGYNGGHSVISRDYDTWANETQRYYRWGSGIYREASAGWDSSPTLQDWLDAGGRSLCTQAEAYLGLGAAQ
ncbi:MAG: hypothetical protein Kow00124_27530 [Anaerolineae bacterium]